MERTSAKWTTAVLATALLSLGACDESGISGPANDKTSLSVYLTDAPGDVEAVWVEILQITLQGGQGGPVSLLGAPTELILLTDLVGTTHLLVENAELDPSTYGQLRLVVGDALLLSADGVVYVKGNPNIPSELEDLPRGNLQCPSCSQSGLKVKLPDDVMELEEGSAALVIDFDVAQSFGHRAGKSGNWIMRPVMYGVLVEGVSAARAVRGTVELAVEGGNPIPLPECPPGEPRTIQDFIPTATLTGIVDGEGNPIIRSGAVAGDGSFQISFLAPGSYSLGHVAELSMGEFVLSFTAGVVPGQVTVGADDVTGVVYTIQSAQCQAEG